MTSSYSTDIVIFGGGIAGLWLLNRLRNEGHQAILLETKKLGGGQTLASQGIIHGGLKYALTGTLTGAANVISAMPARWRQCLAGEGDVDLRGCQILSEHYYMWSDSGFRSKLKTFLGSKSLSGRVEAVGKDAYPPFFKAASVKGTLYKLPDFVINAESLLQVLVEKQQKYIFNIPSDSYSFIRDSSNEIDAVSLQDGESTVCIRAQRFIFSAGEGNQELIGKAQLAKPKAQTRPLNMVYVKGKQLPAVYVHCIGDSFSLTPKLTVTSHTTPDGSNVWYLGGEIAESGVGKDEMAQIQEAKSLLNNVFPWADLQDTQWHCFNINRAEANINNDYRPEDAYFTEESNALVAWPTKLTLTPNLADKISDYLKALDLATVGAEASAGLNDKLKQAETATARWD